MTERPTLHLTNWASKTQYGPGRRLCAMARPRAWERGDGWCSEVAPNGSDLRAWQAGGLTLEEYRSRYEARLAALDGYGCLCPGLLWYGMEGHYPLKSAFVQDGDALLCACPRPDSPRRTHSCHLEWLAPYLVRAGWRVLLYGVEVRL
jgi:hypothetical protein